MAWLHTLHPIVETPLFALTLSLAAYQWGLWLYQRTRQFPLCHPTVIGAVTVAILLPLIELDADLYLQGNQLLVFLLGPATVALAVPLYRELHRVRALTGPILVTLVTGASVAVLSAVGIGWLLGGNSETLLSLAPKSITTPIAIGVSHEIGGRIALTTGVVVFTGAAGISLAPLVFRLLRVHDERVQGFTLGLIAHGIGTARAFEISTRAGAYASLGLCLTGTLTAVVLPVLLHRLTG